MFFSKGSEVDFLLQEEVALFLGPVMVNNQICLNCVMPKHLKVVHVGFLIK